MKLSNKLNPEVRKYINDRKRKNPDVSCRKLALDVSKHFNIKISKSSINNVFKGLKLSAPVGRGVAKIFRPSSETVWAGYVFLYGANIMLGLSKIMASAIRQAYPLIHLKQDTLEAISDAWIMSKAIYNVSLDRMQDYSKNEMWLVVGRKASRGLLKRYVDTFKYLQTFNYQIVSELTHVLQDVYFMRIRLADNSEYMLDGQFRSVWSDIKIPLNFAVNIDIAECYINETIFGSEPMVIFNAKPEAILGEAISDMIFSFDGLSALKRIRSIEYVSHNLNVIKDIQFVVPDKRTFILGIWPWQYKFISEIEKKPAVGKVVLEAVGKGYYFLEDVVRFTQHAQNIDVMLRLIVIKVTKEGPARIALFTNLDKKEWDTKRVVEHYLRHWPNFEASHKIFLDAAKNPEYVENFISGDRILSVVKKLNYATDADSVFAILVEALNEFAKRTFFPNDCAGWGLLKMRELFYKQPGFVKRDMGCDVLFNLFNSNSLENKDLLDTASLKFNEAQVIDYSGRKIWATV